MAQKNFGPDTKIIWKDRKRWCGLPLSFTRYYLVQKPGQWIKLIEDTGLLTSHVEEVNLFRVDDVSIWASFSNKIWGTGTVTVHCKDASSDVVKLVRVRDPQKVRNLIMDMVELERKSRGVQYGEMQM